MYIDLRFDINLVYYTILHWKSCSNCKLLFAEGIDIIYTYFTWLLWRHNAVWARGGGTSILTVTGTCRWTGYDFHGHPYWHRVNLPNWLLAGYSVYHMVACRVPSPQCLWQARHLGTSDATVRAGPQCLWQARDLAPATARAGRNRFLWMYDDTQQNREYQYRVCILTF